MRVCQFNFNNEVDVFEIHINEDGSVIVPGENGEVLAEYASVHQMAEIYAQARDVKPENLKNWVLLENNDVYSFVLRAGTAGVDVSEVEEQLEQVFENLRLEGTHHALSIARAKAQILADGTSDLTDALVHCTETEVARDVYDAMQNVIEGTAVETADTEPEEPEDTRSDLEKYLDEMEEVPGALGLLAFVAGIPVNSEKAALLEALQNNYVLFNVPNLRAIYDNAILDAKNDGIGVNTTEDAITVITQTAVGVKDDAMKARLAATTRLAGRSKVNVSADIVGRTHIRHTAELITVDDLNDMDLFVRDNVPYIVRFSDTIDAELEAEHMAALEEAENDEEEEDREVYAYEEDEYDEDEDY